MEHRFNMGNCLPALFPSWLRSEDHTPLEEVSDTNGSTGSSSRLEQSSYVNELWAAENQANARAPQMPTEEAGKAQLSGMLEQIPADTYTKRKLGDAECPICMVDFEEGDSIRYLPCMHCFHKQCVDDWLMRSFTCPSCMEPVDSAILSSLTAHTVRTLDNLACSPAATGPQQKPS